jgi:hypothetical protein
MTTRTVICHYHIFKTAGTSFEALLKQNFGEDHISFDGPTSASSIDQASLTRIIRESPDARAFSSHQIALPAPDSSDLNILPAVFIRHPLLRIRSVFLHGMRDRPVKPAVDVMVDFDAWFGELAAGHPNQLQICNLQTNVLSREPDQPPQGRNEGGRPLYDLDNAMKNLAAVELIGRVEHFDQDVARFPSLIAAHGLRFRVEQPISENVGSPDFSLTTQDQLSNFRSQVAAATWDRLLWFNEQDLTLWESVCERLEH